MSTRSYTLDSPGPLAELLAKVDPKLYTKYLVKENGKTVMYVQLQKALYGTLSAALLFWRDLSGLPDRGGVHPEPLRQLCHEQDGGWHTMHRAVARGRLEDFTRQTPP